MSKPLCRSLITLLFGITLLTGCVTVPPQPDATPASQPDIWSAQRYYDEARQAQANGDFSSALTQLAELQQRYPDSAYTKLVALESSYAHYKIADYPAAIQAADQFIAQQPNASAADYAWYLKGMAHLNLAGQNNTNSTTFDSDNSRTAYQSLLHLAQEFPNSPYRTEALQQLQPLRTQLAEHELDITYALLQQGNQQGARDRAAYLLKSYPETTAANTAQLILQSGNANTIHPEGLQHEKWLMQQNPNHFTLQIAGSRDKQWLDKLVAQHTQQIVWFQRLWQGEPWYTVLYGHYNSAAEAEAAMPAVKSTLTVNEAWVQPFSTIQQRLHDTDANH